MDYGRIKERRTRALEKSGTIAGFTTTNSIVLKRQGERRRAILVEELV
jgi:hypothetical protein